jgi:hypothetical protein
MVQVSAVYLQLRLSHSFSFFCSIYGFVLLGLTALTEQTTFVALLLYRMELWEVSGRFFLFSAVWTLVSKTFLVVLVCYFWGVAVVELFLHVPGNEDLAMWVYIFWIMLVPLYGSQIYSAVIMVRLWKVCRQKAALEKENRLQPSVNSKNRNAREEIDRQLHPLPSLNKSQSEPVVTRPSIELESLSPDEESSRSRILVDSGAVMQLGA